MKTINPVQEEQVKEIGAYLRQVREQKFISIEEIAAKTRIRLLLLQALEAGKLDELPEAIFVQGFVRHYGDALGLDGSALAKDFPLDALPIVVDSDTNIPLYKTEDVRTPATTKAAFVYVPFVLLILAVVGGLFYFLNSSRKGELAANKQSPAAQSLATTPKPQTPQPQEPIQVTVDMKGDAWVRVVADGNTQFEGTLNQGKKQTWTAKNKLTIRSGNAGAVFASFNQKPAQALGKVGEIKEVAFAPERER